MTVDESMLLDGRYRLQHLLGRGGMADVYRGRDELLNRDVAIKVLRELEDPVLRARFMAEARLLASLNHPGLITLLDAGIRADSPYLVMTLADGPTLAARIAAAPLPPELAAVIGAQLAEALGYAHEQGVVHRDVKPSNVLLADESRALLADFGIARLAGELEQYTRTGETIASAAYLSPEQAAGEEITSAADIYSLGLVLLESMTGQRAFPGTPVESAVRRLTTSPPIPVSLPRAWRDLLTAMTERDPAARPGGAEVAARLAAITAGAPAQLVDAADAADAAATGTQTFQAPLATVPSEADASQTAQWASPSDLATVTRGWSADEVRPPRRAWVWRLVAAAVVVTAVGIFAVLFLRPAPQAGRSTTAVPSGVPSHLQGPLQRLHQAVDGASR